MKTPQEYREKLLQEKIVTLPSGLECSIRAVPTMVILDLTQKAESDRKGLDEFMTENLAETLDAVIPSSVVSPTIRPARKAGEETIDEDALFLDELVIGDLNVLFLQIMDISGISKEDIEKQLSFRGKRTRKKRSNSSQ